jgi:hypothetical protein
LTDIYVHGVQRVVRKYHKRQEWRTSRVSGSAARSRSQKAVQSVRVASSKRSPSGMSAAIMRTPRVISGRLLVIVVIAAPTAVWSTSSVGPAPQVFNYVVKGTKYRQLHLTLYICRSIIALTICAGIVTICAGRLAGAGCE